MLGYQSELKLANKSIADGEKQIEVTRQVLAQQNEFEPIISW